MRGALKKPAVSINKIQNLRPGFNPEREAHAKETAQHSKVSRFGGFVSTAQPADKSKGPILHGEIINRTPPKNKKDGPAASTVMPSMVASASHSRLERMLDEALTHADAHKQAMKYQAARHFWQRPGFFSKRRGAKLGVLAFVILSVSAVVAWQKIPQFSVKLAAVQAHVDASVPAYQPAGYGVDGPAKAANHAVTIQYASSEDKSKVYTVQEQPSSQDSASLIADSSTPSQPVQTAQTNGIPIVMVKNQVKCVSNGLLTTVTNRANLSPDELMNIAKGVCS